MIDWLLNLFGLGPRDWPRLEPICYCPGCRANLLAMPDEQKTRDELTGLWHLACDRCECLSIWDFSPPVPVLLDTLILRLGLPTCDPTAETRPKSA